MKFKSEEKDKEQWYVLRVLFGRELKLKEELSKLDIKCFVPLKYIETTKEGKTKRKLVSAISNILFIHTNSEVIDAVKSKYKYTLPFSYLIDKATKKPMIVRDREMCNFIAITGNRELTEYVHYLGKEAQNLKRGEEVVIKSGIFKGIKGRIVRVKRQRRVMVELQGIANVVTAYIPNEFLERENKQTEEQLC